jgi:hypothetical protein
VWEQIGCTVRNSLIRVDGEEAIAVSANSISAKQTAQLRNVTAIATGPKSVGLRASFGPFFDPSGSETLVAKNVIASGEASDLESHYLTGPANITVSNSNFDTVKQDEGTSVVDAGGNQTAPPLFVDAANGDYREAAGSPTIDAGAADPLIGELDFAGISRAQGPAPDIGAYEVAVPPAPPIPPAEIQSLSVSPTAFVAVNIGGAIVSAARKAHVGATVSYSLSAPATVAFTVERKTFGRKVGGKCRKPTRANRTKKKCPLFKPVKGGFTHSGSAGANRFKFSGRIQNKALKPGRYRLVASAGPSTKRAPFGIVK